ncbi:MAG: site-specific integrase [Planctomycetes bacterium]|nr:site-specific integrase [Planctomycetota bacterium]
MGLHKTSGQARVVLSGVEHYLGVWGTAESHERYAALVKKWLADGKQPQRRAPTVVQAVLTLRSLFDQFLAHADASGRYWKNGAPTTQRAQFDWVGDSLAATLGTLPVARLTEAGLMAWRDVLEQNRQRTRSGINRLVAAALQVLRWGRSRGLVPKPVWADVSVIEPLKRGEVGDRPEKGRPRRAVTAEEAERVAAKACRQVGAMIRLQALCGMRPGEVCCMRWVDIDKAPILGDKTGCWTYIVPNGKTSHHGHVTRYLLPVVAQKILLQFPALPLAYIFSPAAAMEERRNRLRAGRQSKLTPSHRERDAEANRDYATRWGLNEYRHAVDRACALAGVARFTPHELRHGFVTWAANTLSLTAAAAAANHRNLTTTQGYVHVRHDDALAVAAAVEARMRG